jgi:hypothetical protein
MKRNPKALNFRVLKHLTLAASLLSGVFLLNAQPADAQSNTPPGGTATRPAKEPPEQTSVPSTAPPATTTQTTGQPSQDPTVKQMNEAEKAKVEREGK